MKYLYILDIVIDIAKMICIAAGIFCIGICGGLICGFIIVSLTFYLGNSGTTGAEYVGYWSPGEALFLGGSVGSFVGGVSFWLAYYTVLREISWNKILIVTFAGTILGGCVGAFSNPYAAFFGAIIGFWCACFILLDFNT